MLGLLSCGQHWGWDSFSGSRTFRSHCVDSTRSETSEAMAKQKLRDRLGKQALLSNKEEAKNSMLVEVAGAFNFLFWAILLVP